MRAIDTNVVVRLIVRDDAAQTASAEHFIRDGAWLSGLALAEAIWVLATVYKFSSNDLIGAIEMIIDNRQVVLQDHEAVAAAVDLFRAKPSLGFSACLILNLARTAGHLPLGTFDRNLARVEGAHRL